MTDEELEKIQYEAFQAGWEACLGRVKGYLDEEEIYNVAGDVLGDEEFEWAWADYCAYLNGDYCYD